ncbi:hypothetical protein CABS03_06570 [Colletotrichum abscissum]
MARRQNQKRPRADEPSRAAIEPPTKKTKTRNEIIHPLETWAGSRDTAVQIYVIFEATWCLSNLRFPKAGFGRHKGDYSSSEGVTLAFKVL